MSDPVETLHRARADDPERVIIREICHAWREAIGTGANTGLPVKSLCALTSGEAPRTNYEGPSAHATLHEALVAAVGHEKNMTPRNLGAFLRRSKGRVVDSLRLSNKDDSRGARWFLEQI